ncbi:PRA1 family protein H [Asparagus officinalis]|uniref:PRA1 family protein H n=1 Tax=Asparagus officinalis TaxID=4686 RepID=UPI00098E3762|nr:PRA1 family protein H [Asparagus officinalis]
MVFSANPLSLSVPDPAFESWLRDTGYLELLDSHSSSSSSSTDTCPPSASKTPNPNPTLSKTPKSLFSLLKTLVSLLTLNPFAKLTPDDFAGSTPSWTLAFIGSLDSYSWPNGPSQARMRVQENVRRYARNYAFLSLIFLACSLYQMPVPLLGVVLSLMMWEGVRFCSERWEMEEKCPGLRMVLVRIVQCATAVVLYLCNLQIAFFCAISVSYTVMILHASLRKLAPPKQSTVSSRHKRLQPR